MIPSERKGEQKGVGLEGLADGTRDRGGRGEINVADESAGEELGRGRAWVSA